MAEKLDMVFIILFVSPTHKITYIAGYLTVNYERQIFNGPVQCVE